MMSVKEELVVAAFDLSQRAPKEWDAFMQAFDMYVADAVKKLVASEPAMLSNFQGQAVQAMHIFTTLRECRQTVQTAERMRSAKPAVEKTRWPSK